MQFVPEPTWETSLQEEYPLLGEGQLLVAQVIPCIKQTKGLKVSKLKRARNNHISVVTDFLLITSCFLTFKLKLLFYNISFFHGSAFSGSLPRDPQGKIPCGLIVLFSLLPLLVPAHHYCIACIRDATTKHTYTVWLNRTTFLNGKSSCLSRHLCFLSSQTILACFAIAYGCI